MKKRTLSFVLILVLILTLLPSCVLATPGSVAVQIDGITLEDGKYLRSGGTMLVESVPAEGGYAILNGDVLTLYCYSSATGITITGDAELHLMGNSALTSNSGTALTVSGNLTVTGNGSLQAYSYGNMAAIAAADLTVKSGSLEVFSEFNETTAAAVVNNFTMEGGSLEIYGKASALAAVNFTMTRGTMLVGAGTGGTGINATGTVTYIGGDLAVDAAHSFGTADTVAVTPGSGSAVTVWSTPAGAMPQQHTQFPEGTLPVTGNTRYYFTDRATTVTILDIPMEQGMYLPSGSDHPVSTAPAEGGYAVLNGNVLTLHDFEWEGSSNEGEGEKGGFISATGTLILNLEGQSNLLTNNYSVIRTDRDLLVGGSGSLWGHCRIETVSARNFVMESGRLHLTTERGGSGIVVNDSATFISGDLIIDTDQAFYSYNYVNDSVPVVYVSPAADAPVTVHAGSRIPGVGSEPYTNLYTYAYSTVTESGPIAIRNSNGLLYQRFRFTTDSTVTTAEPWPKMPVELYGLQVAGVRVTEENTADILGDGTVSFDPTTNTLTLNNTNLSYAGTVISAPDMKLTVDVQGVCTVISETSSAFHLGQGATIRGGRLILKAGSHGLFLHHDTEIIDCDITVESEDYSIYVNGETTITGCSITVNSGDYGIYINDNLKISDSTIAMESDSSGLYVPAGSIELLDSHVVTNTRSGIGIYTSGNMIIDRSYLDNTGTGDGLNATHLEIRDSVVSSTGGEDGVWLRSPGTLKILRSTVTFNGAQNAVQIKGGPSLIQDSTVKANGRTDIAILAEQGLSIERSRVTANAPKDKAAIAVNAGYDLKTDCGFATKEVVIGNTTRVVLVDKNGNVLLNAYTGHLEDLKDQMNQVEPAPKPAAPAVELPFTDVSADDWFYDEVCSAWQNDLIDGLTETEFQPDGTLTVAQAIKLAAALKQMLLYGNVTLENGTEAWYSTYVDYAVSEGILSEHYKGYTAAQMNAPISRREFVSIFFGAMDADSYHEKNQVADNAIPDVKLTDAHGEAIYAFYRAGILTGSDDAGTFRPDSTIKRSETAAILIRMYDTTARQSITLK